MMKMICLYGFIDVAHILLWTGDYSNSRMILYLGIKKAPPWRDIKHQYIVFAGFGSYPSSISSLTATTALKISVFDVGTARCIPPMTM